MEKKPRVEFLSNGTKVKIVFSDESESKECSTKSELIEESLILFKQNKLTDVDVVRLTDQTLDSIELPEGAKFTKEISDELFRIGFAVFEKAVKGEVSEEDLGMRESETSPEVANFEMCFEAADHGHFTIHTGSTSEPIYSKSHGVKMIARMLKDEYINKDEEKKLTEELEKSPLPA